MRAALALATALTLLAAAPALASLPQMSGAADLKLGQHQGKVTGASGLLLTGGTAAVGDVNGDGIGDLAAVVDEGARNAVWVLFGREGLSLTLAAAGPGNDGIRIASAADSLDVVAGAGDVSGDGKSDVVIGAPSAASNRGAAYVVFGRGAGTVDLGAAGFGYKIIGAAAGDQLGSAVDGAGDVSNDGRPDVVVGAPGVSSNNGKAYLVPGKADSGEVTAGSTGFEIRGPVGSSRAGAFVAGLGDVSGDGRPDVGVGGPQYNGGDGIVWVVFGRGDGQHVDVSGDGLSNGFAIKGATTSLAGPVAGAGDITGDGKAEVAVGAPAHVANGSIASGSVSVVFGTADAAPVLIGGLGEKGYQFFSTATEGIGTSVAGGQDVNGDGLPDVVAGAPGADPPDHGGDDAGNVYTIFGKTAAGTTGAGWKIAGVRGQASGQSPSAIGSGVDVGDVNGDSRPDVLVGMANGAVPGGTDPGAAFVLYGYGNPFFSLPALASGTQGTAINAIGPSAIRRTGPATFTATGLPSGLGMNTATGDITGTPAVPGSFAATVTMNDLTSPAFSASRSLNFTIAAAPPVVGPDKTPPVITGARLLRRRFRVSRRPTAISGQKRPAPFGTSVRFRLSEPATLKATIACAKPIRGKRKKACRKFAKKNVLTRKFAQSAQLTLAFSGRVGKVPFPLGKGTITLVATDAAKNVSKAVVLKFTAVKR